MTPPDGEASAPDFEENLEKDPHEAKIPEFAGLNVKNQACSPPRLMAHTWHVRRSPQRCFFGAQEESASVQTQPDRSEFQSASLLHPCAPITAANGHLCDELVGVSRKRRSRRIPGCPRAGEGASSRPRSPRGTALTSAGGPPASAQTRRHPRRSLPAKVSPLCWHIHHWGHPDGYENPDYFRGCQHAYSQHHCSSMGM